MPEEQDGQSDLSALHPVDKAAILLMALPEQDAAEIIKYLSPREVNRISAAIARLDKVPTVALKQVMAEFVERVGANSAIGFGASEHLRNALSRALGEERASALIDRIMTGGESTGIEAVKWEDPRVVAETIREEHPQIVALILAYVEPAQAQEIMQALPDRVIEQVIPRLATLEMIPPSAVRELNEALEDQLVGGSQQTRASNISGIKAAADILNRFEARRAESVLESVKQIDPDLARRIYDNMFVFSDLVQVDDRSVRTLLREVDPKLLVAGLKGVSQPVHDKIMRNISQRAAESLREEMEARGPLRVAEIEAAQKEVLSIAKRLEAEGKIVLRTEQQDLVA